MILYNVSISPRFVLFPCIIKENKTNREEIHFLIYDANFFERFKKIHHIPMNMPKDLEKPQITGSPNLLP